MCLQLVPSHAVTFPSFWTLAAHFVPLVIVGSVGRVHLELEYGFHTPDAERKESNHSPEVPPLSVQWRADHLALFGSRYESCPSGVALGLKCVFCWFD